LLISSICVAQEDCQNLLKAASQGSIQDIQVLLDAGIDVNIQNEGGVTALLRAVEYGQLDCMKLLLEKGADHTIRDQHRWTPLLLAKFNADYYGNKAEVIDVLELAAQKK